jgi:hypothetical protein
MATAESPVQRASAEFVAEFARWRLERGMSKKQLAAEMGFDPSYLSHVEAHRHRPTEDFAKRAEAVLQSGGAIWRRFREYDELRATARAGRQPSAGTVGAGSGAGRASGGAGRANGPHSDAWMPPTRPTRSCGGISPPTAPAATIAHAARIPERSSIGGCLRQAMMSWSTRPWTSVSRMSRPL